MTLIDKTIQTKCFEESILEGDCISMSLLINSAGLRNRLTLATETM